MEVNALLHLIMRQVLYTVGLHFILTRPVTGLLLSRSPDNLGAPYRQSVFVNAFRRFNEFGLVNSKRKPLSIFKVALMLFLVGKQQILSLIAIVPHTYDGNENDYIYM